MIAIISLILTAGSLYILWQILGELRTIAKDARAKEELADALEKLGNMFGGKKKKNWFLKDEPEADE